MYKNLIKRESYIKGLDEYIDSDFIKFFVGIRRCGKTSLLYSLVDELKNKGIKEENIIFISFESPEYNLIENFQELDEIVYNKVNDIDGKIYLFFDEIQEVKEWEKSINGYRVSFDCDIYISGSNSKLLSNELSTLLAGRYIKINVYPFSFKEFLQYMDEIENIDLNNDKIELLFKDHYLNYGGMPGILSLKANEFKISALRDIYNSIIFNDIISRFKIRNIDLLKRFIRFMISSTGQTFSSKKIKNYLRNNKIYTTQDTLLKYNEYLQETFFLSKCRRQDLIGKKEMKIYEKYYLMDHGFHNALIGSNEKIIGRILENIVYIELLRRSYEVNVGKIYDKEIGFVCKKNGKYIYIQVSYLLANEKTIKREFRPLMNIPDKYDTYVISMDQFDLSRDGIKHRNLIDFLLSNEI